MVVTLAEAFEMIERGETPEQYRKRMKRIRTLGLERDALHDAIEILGDDPRAQAKKERLAKVEGLIQKLA